MAAGGIAEIARRVVRRLCVLSGAIPLLWIAAAVLTIRWQPDLPGTFTDSDAYANAAFAIRAGESPYDPLPPKGPHRAGENAWHAWYLYPPPLAAAVSLVPVGSHRHVWVILVILGTIATFAFCAAVSRLAGWQGLCPIFALAGVLLFFKPHFFLVGTGNVHPVVDAASALALIATPAAAAALLTVGAAIKVTPVWGLIALMLRRGRRGAAGMVIATFAVLVVCVAALGIEGLIQASRTWLVHVAPTVSQGQYQTGDFLGANLSPAFALVAAVVDRPEHGAQLPLPARLFLTAVQAGVPLLLVWGLRHRDPVEHVGWVLIGATLAAPLVRPGYLTILLVAPALLIRSRRMRASPAQREDRESPPLPVR